MTMKCNEILSQNSQKESMEIRAERGRLRENLKFQDFNLTREVKATALNSRGITSPYAMRRAPP